MQLFAVEDFLTRCNAEGISVDFVTTHLSVRNLRCSLLGSNFYSMRWRLGIRRVLSAKRMQRAAGRTASQNLCWNLLVLPSAMTFRSF